MDKDEPEKSKLFNSQIKLNKNEEEKSKDIEIKPSIYKIKKNESINPMNPDKHSLKKNLTQTNQEKDNNNNIKESKIAYEENNNKEKGINKRYNYYQNDEGFEDDEISENNTPKEKPDLNYYNKKKINLDKQETLQISGEKNQMMQSTNKKNTKLLKKENDENIENNIREISPKKQKEIEEIQKFIENQYIIHKKYIDKTTFFIILYSIGILLSLLSCISCLYLELYSNHDVLFIIGILSFFSLIIYILWIIFSLKDKKYVLFIINSKGNPEKIHNSKYRKVSVLFLCLIMLLLNYIIVFMLVNTLYLNNTKLSIRGKAYDSNQWIELFSDKNYSEIMSLFERSNIFFLVCGWLNYLLMLFIAIYQSYLLFSYRYMKSVIKILCFFAFQGGLYQIYLSMHCYRFRDITSLESVKISWVTPGTISTGVISIILSIFAFYVFFTENKRGIIILQLFCVLQWILLLIFTVGLGSIEDKFYNYKKAKCNSLFKFISEDYLLKNKFNGCNSKYLFTTEELNNIECPKERIMINWERTENLFNNLDNNGNDNNNIISINEENNSLYFGCINQACCLQIYFDIKNKFDLLFILSIHQTIFFMELFFICFYINCNIEDNLDEEISEKINFLAFGIITLLIFVVILPFMVTLPKASSQSKLNLIDNNEVSESLSIINKDNIRIDADSLYKATNESFNEIKGKIINDFKYNLIFDYLNDNNFNFKLSMYEYSFVTEGLDIMIDNNILKKINCINFESNYFDNSTETITFKTKTNIINNIFEYFDFIPRNPLRNELLLNIEINAIYSQKNSDDKYEEMNGSVKAYKDIIIHGNDIQNNYDEEEKSSNINIIKKELDFSIMNKINASFFYIKGNIIDDIGNSLINVYNYLYSNEPIFSTKSHSNGTFIIGPIYKLIKSNTPYYLSLEISKIKSENQNNDLSVSYEYDENYCKYYNLIKIDEYTFQIQNFYSIKNIQLPEYKKGNMELSGIVREFDDTEQEDFLSHVDIKLFYGEQINKALEFIELNSISLDENSLDSFSIGRTSTKSNGEYSLKISKTGQYMLLFIKSDYYIEKYIFTIDEIKEGTTLQMGTMQLIKLFNSGQIMVKLEWDLKPPDLDLFCRFQVSKNYFCYTFFGNKVCGKTEFFIDNKLPEQISSEIIEISEFSDYLYLFYVRKYFDNSKGKTQNEFKIEGVENDKDMDHTEMYTVYDEYLNNTSSNIYIYSNGYKIPAIKIPIPDYELNDDNKDKEYIYWAAFCINGNEGINSLKIINQYMQNEPAKNICMSYYEEDKIVKFKDD